MYDGSFVTAQNQFSYTEQLGLEYGVNVVFMKGPSVVWIRRTGCRIHGGAVRELLDFVDTRPLVSRTVPGCY